MDLILFILSVTREPMLASEIGPLLARDPNAIRATLALLEKDKLAEKIKVSNKGPTGTYRWRATETGKACVQHLLLWIAAQGKR